MNAAKVLPHETLVEMFRNLEDAYARYPLPVPPPGERPTAEELRADPAAQTLWFAWDAAAGPVWAARRRDPVVRRIMSDIATANLRLVMSIARKLSRNSMRLMDIVAAGNEGLLTAIERFNWHRGYRFSTYATWWIKQAMRRCITENRRTIRMPAHASKVQRDMLDAAEAIEAAGGIVPDRTELARITGSSETVARATLHTARGTVPLDAKFKGSSGEEGRTLADVVPDMNADPFRDVSEMELLDVVSSVVAELTEKEEAIIRLRFGLSVDRSDDAGYPITEDEYAAIAVDNRGLGAELQDMCEPCADDIAAAESDDE